MDERDSSNAAAERPGYHLLVYDFADFLQRMSEMDLRSILRESDREADRAEALSYNVPGRVANRQAGSVEYARKLKAFLFFLQHRQLPGFGLDDRDWAVGYRAVAAALVRRGEWDREVLDLFPPDPTEEPTGTPKSFR